MNEYTWYKKLKKPTWAPPSWLFGPVWTFLYLLIAISFGITFISVARGTFPIIVILPFVLNLIFNFAFTPIQFGLKSNALASIDVLLVLITLIWLIVTIYPYSPIISYLQIPYLLWVSFATFLQLNITFLNKK